MFGTLKKTLVLTSLCAMLTPANVNAEVQSGAFTGVMEISAAGNSSFAVKEDGSLWTWGENRFGELGNGTRLIHAWAPVKAQLEEVKAVSGTAVLKEDGTVWTWGWNQDGILGIGQTPEPFVLTPKRVNLGKVISLQAASGSSFAVQEDGTVWGWGQNYDGRLGVPYTTDTSKPVQIPGLFNVVKVATNGQYSLALTEAGDVWGWGIVQTETQQPQQINGLSNIIDIGASTWQFTALKSDGSVWGWDHIVDQIADIAPPAKIEGLPKIKALSDDGEFPGAIDFEGNAWIWIYNGVKPHKVQGISRVRDLATSGGHWLAVTEEGHVYAWGQNKQGQLGINQVVDEVMTPVPVMNAISVVLNDKALVLPVSPLLVSSRTLVPLRGVLEQMDVDVVWNDEQRTVTLMKGDKQIVLEPGSAEANVNGKAVVLDQASEIVNDRVFVPLRFISETLGAAVEWDEKAYSVEIRVHE